VFVPERCPGIPRIVKGVCPGAPLNILEPSRIFKHHRTHLSLKATLKGDTMVFEGCRLGFSGNDFTKDKEEPSIS
jgi:hypothetical protein